MRFPLSSLRCGSFDVCLVAKVGQRWFDEASVALAEPISFRAIMTAMHSDAKYRRRATDAKGLTVQARRKGEAKDRGEGQAPRGRLAGAKDDAKGGRRAVGLPTR
jgi:hypothetical protein